jgi:hypothetical protein
MALQLASIAGVVESCGYRLKLRVRGCNLLLFTTIY